MQGRSTDKDGFVQIRSRKNPRSDSPQQQGKGRKGGGPSNSNHFAILTEKEEEGVPEGKEDALEPQESKESETEEQMEAMKKMGLRTWSWGN